MKDPVRGAIVLASTLFLMVSVGADVGVASLYVRGTSRVRAAGAILDRQFRGLARPIEFKTGEAVPRATIEEHLRRIGYYPDCHSEPGCYASAPDSLTIWARDPEFPDIRIVWNSDTIVDITSPARAPVPRAIVEPETLLTLQNDPGGTFSRSSSDPLPFAAIVDTPLLDAIIASEDHSFANHHGFDFTRLAFLSFLRGGGSTITMQVARLDVLQDRRRTLRRKLDEIGVAMALERVYAKSTILTAYVNTVYLGASGGRPISGFGAAAREFFAVDDVRRLSPLQAATLVALLNQPSRYLDHLRGGDETHLRAQRNRVLRLMNRNMPERYSAASVDELEKQPVVLAPSRPAADDLHKASRHFLDYALGANPAPPRARVYLTLDARLQRLASEVVERGLADLERQHARLTGAQVQAALVAIDPRTGEVLAMIGGRSYDRSQFNRAVSAERQVGSLMKPFDYLAAFERTAAERDPGISPATIVVDEPTVFRFAGRRPWKPANYGNSYAGPVTWRRALAESRNVAAVKVAAGAGIDPVAHLWAGASRRSSEDTFPALALGANRATPLEVATAYATLANLGVARALHATSDRPAEIRATSNSAMADGPGRRLATAETTAMVTDMMRSVLDEGTARGARTAGFTADAAGKTGTTDDLRDAWFAGFTSDLLTVVWVGRDDNRSIGLTGAQAALPIWTEFMKRAR